MTTDAHASSSESVEPPAQGPEKSPASSRVLVLALVGVGAAATAVAAMTAIGEVFTLPPELAALGVGGIPGAEDQRRIVAGNKLIQSQHAALWLGSAAAILGGAFGLTMGLFRRSVACVLRGLALGAVLGGVCGAGAGMLSIWIDRWHHDHLPQGELAVSDFRIMLMHAATWLVIGAGCGLGVGLGAASNRWRVACGGLLVVGLAAALGGAVYPMLVSIALPLADPSLPIPEPGTARLAWLGLPAVLMGLVLGRKG